MNPYIVKLSIVDDEPTLDVSTLSPTVSSAVQKNAWSPHQTECQRFNRHTGCFLLQGMGVVVHQALTEYNRWDLKLFMCQKKILMVRCMMCRGHWRHRFSLTSPSNVLFLFLWENRPFVLVVIYIWQLSLVLVRFSYEARFGNENAVCEGSLVHPCASTSKWWMTASYTPLFLCRNWTTLDNNCAGCSKRCSVNVGLVTMAVFKSRCFWCCVAFLVFGSFVVVVFHIFITFYFLPFFSPLGSTKTKRKRTRVVSSLPSPVW